MTWNTRCNQTTNGRGGRESGAYPAGRRHVVSVTWETGSAGVARQENNLTNMLGADETAGTPIIFKAHDYRPCGTNQYDENPVVIL